MKYLLEIWIIFIFYKSPVSLVIRDVSLFYIIYTQLRSKSTTCSNLLYGSLQNSHIISVYFLIYLQVAPWACISSYHHSSYIYHTGNVRYAYLIKTEKKNVCWNLLFYNTCYLIWLGRSWQNKLTTTDFK